MCWFHVGRRHPRTCAVGGLCKGWANHRAFGEAMRHRKYTCAGDRDRQGCPKCMEEGASSAWMRRGSWPEELSTQRQNPSNEGLTLWE